MQVELPPRVSVTSCARIGVMIVVPAFAVGEEADQNIVAAILAGFVVTIPPTMRHGIDGPRRMQVQDGAYEHAPHQEACAELGGSSDILAHNQTGGQATAKERQPAKTRD